MISYIKTFKSSRSEAKTVSHEEFNSWKPKDFDEGMNEILKDQEYRRLYFDFDDMKTKDDLDEVINWLKGLSSVFGRVCYAGYTTNEDIYQNEEYQKFIGFVDEDLQKKFDYHVISVHAVFPDSCINTNELYEICCEKTEYDLNRFVDKKVYKKLGMNQLLRHPFSPKNQNSTRPTGFNFEDYEMPKASDLVATCSGHEKVIEKSEWSKVFNKKLVSNVDELVDEMIAQESKSEIIDETADEKDDMLNFDETKTDMSKELFEALYKGFEGLEIHGDVQKTENEISLFPLFSALYSCVNVNIDDEDINDSLDFIRDNARLTENAKSKWSEKRKQAKKNDKCKGPGALFNYLKIFNSDYYNSNVKPLLPKKKVEAKFDLKDNFTTNDIRDKFGCYQIDNNPEKLDYNAVLSDLKRVMIIVDSQDGIYVFKVRDSKNDKMTLEFTSRTTAFNRLKDLKVGTEAKITKTEKKIITKTAFDVIDSSNNNASFYKNSVCFYSVNPKDFSFFQGYKYEQKRNDDIIKGFNEHIKSIWCKGDENLYKYVQSWFATIIQEPLNRAYTALVIKGEEGLGKNTITDAWSELLSGYSNSNVSDLNSIIGKFNSAVENKKLLVMNEMDSVDLNSKAVFNGLKKLITEDTTDINEKNIKVRDGVQNVSNLVILSNEFNPVKISSKDRRYCVITPSENKVGDRKYFDELYSTMKESRHKYRKDFMEALMYYYMNYKIDVDLRDIPDTFEREMLKEANKGAIESFVEEKCIELSEDGIEPKVCYNIFKAFISENNFKSNYKLNSFIAEMSKYCKFDSDGKQSKYKGKRVYRFTDAVIEKYKSLIESKKKDNEEIVDELC